MTGFYHCFIPGYYEFAKPMAKLTRHNCKFHWSEQCDRSFQTLKQSLTSAPVLASPDLSKPYILYTDASDSCIGSVLT